MPLKINLKTQMYITITRGPIAVQEKLFGLPFASHACQDRTTHVPNNVTFPKTHDLGLLSHDWVCVW